MYMEHHTYSKVITYSPYACAAQCLMSSVCLSFSYNKHRQICHLNDNNTAVNDIVSMYGFIYSDINLWPESLSGPCSVTSCPGNSRCQVDRLHRASCVPEFQGCGNPPEISGSQRKYEGHFLSAMVIFSCSVDYMTCKNKTTSVCLSTGQWENVTGLCGQFRWHNPVPETRHYLPCGSENNFRVRIVAIPNSNERISIDVTRGDDILFHIDFRIDIWGMTNTTVINTFIGGVWGSHILLPFVPIIQGQEFDLVMNLENGEYKVTVDGAFVYSFVEILSGGQPEFILVYSDVSTSLVEFTV